MSDIDDILTELKLGKGDLLRSGKAMTLRQLRARIQRYIESKWPLLDQLDRPEEFAQWQEDLRPTQAAAIDAFRFNSHLEARNTARARLAQHAPEDDPAAIERDATERAEAQAVLDSLPQEVLDWEAAS